MRPNHRLTTGSDSSFYRPPTGRSRIWVPLAVASVLGLFAMAGWLFLFVPTANENPADLGGIDPMTTGAVPAELDKPGM